MCPVSWFPKVIYYYFFFIPDLLCDSQHHWNFLIIHTFLNFRSSGTNPSQTFMAARALNQSLFHCRLALPDSQKMSSTSLLNVYTHKLGIWLCPIFFTFSSHSAFLPSFPSISFSIWICCAFGPLSFVFKDEMLPGLVYTHMQTDCILRARTRDDIWLWETTLDILIISLYWVS